MISDNLPKLINEALKQGDELKVSTLRLLSSALHYASIDKKDMKQEDELEVVRKEAKKRREAIEAYEKANAKERAEKEKKELEILTSFLPKELSEEEINKKVKELLSSQNITGKSDFGRAMGLVMKELKGKANGEVVAKAVQNYLFLQKAPQ